MEARRILKSEECFLAGLPSGARQWRGFHHSGIFDKVSSSEVIKTLPVYSRALRLICKQGAVGRN